MNHVSCRFDFEPNLPKVKIDFKKITYCLRSLVTNAIEAMSAGGQIQVRSALFDDEIHITLTDTGPGMSAETIQAITTPFFSTKESGSGLGLSLCLRILEEHDANLGIASEVGKGTIFTIRLKISREDKHDPNTDR
jgi:hypothetical protein